MNTDFSAAPFFIELIIILAVVLPLYHIVGKQVIRRAILVAVGMYILFLVAPRLLFFYLAYWMLIWAFIRLYELLSGDRPKKAAFFFILIFSLLPMLAWKIYPQWFTLSFNLYFQRLLWAISDTLGALDANNIPIIVVGLSFNTFRALELIIQSYLGLSRGAKLGEVLSYAFFPPILFVGPIIEPGEMKSNSLVSGITASDIAYGARRIAVGFVKLYVLAMPLEQSALTIQGYAKIPGPHLMFAVFLFAWYFYFNFAGFSDIAIGCARLLGFKLKENFNYPYFQPNIQQFWANWHMSLTRFAQRNVYVPLGGFRARTQYIAIIGTIMTIALWHDISVNLVVFGIYHAAGLCWARYYSNYRKSQAGSSEDSGYKWLGILATFTYVMLSMPLVMISKWDIVPFYSKLLIWW